MKVTSIEELFGTLQQSIVAEWRKHLKTSKYSKHMALDEFYTEMPDKVDTLIEDYMGHVGEKVEDYVNVLKAEDLDALQYLKELHEVCTSGREFLDGVPELESDLDDILSLIDSTMYKVRELKESKMKDLKDYLNENINESLITISLIAATTFFSIMMITSSLAAGINASTSDLDPRSPWQVIKDDISGFFKDKKLKKIAEKYKDDPDIVKYLTNPKKAGWRKMLETKLEPDEIQYINSLTRNYFK